MRRYAFIIPIVAGVYVAHMLTDNVQPYVYKHGEFHPNPVPNNVDRVLLDWQISVNRLCPGDVLRKLFDADKDVYDPAGKRIDEYMFAAYDRTPASISVKLGSTRLPKTFELPPVTPSTPRPKNIRYEANVCFRCNLLQTIFPLLCFDTPTLYLATTD